MTTTKIKHKAARLKVFERAQRVTQLAILNCYNEAADKVITRALKEVAKPVVVICAGSDIVRTCESCKHIRLRTPKDIKVDAGYALARHWCAKNDQSTLPGALRCGGDDYEKDTYEKDTQLP